MSTNINTAVSSSIKPVVKLPETVINQKGKVIITPEFKKQIDYLHKKVGSKEWCGFMFYTITEGDFTNFTKLVIRPDDIFLMDIGESAHTAAAIDGDDLFDMYATIPGAEDNKKYGLIHTHHTMNTFFSGTDTDELATNVHNHNYYLSLIVNFAGVYCAKLAFLGEMKTCLSYKNANDEPYTSEVVKKVMYVVEMNVVMDEGIVEVPNYISERFLELDKKRTERVQTFAPTYYSTPGGLFGAGGHRAYAGAGSSAHNPTDRVNFEKDNDEEKWESSAKSFSRSATEWEEEWYREHGFDKRSKTQEKKETPTKLSNQTDAEGKRTLIVDNEARELICKWLTECLKLVKGSEKFTIKNFLTVREALSYFTPILTEALSTNETRPHFEFFFATSQKLLADVVKDYTSFVVSRRLPQFLRTWSKEFPVIAEEFAKVIEDHPQYLIETERAKKEEII